MDRQELWNHVKELGGRDAFILHEMKRLGFWDVSQGVPQLSEELRQQRLVLEGELSDAVKKQAVYRNKKKMLRDMRKKRMAEAKMRRTETKEKRLHQKEERAANWTAEMAQDIKWLGEGVSGGLKNKTNNTTQLEALGLPVYNTLKDLSDAMKTPMNEIRFLAFDKKVSHITHYKSFKVAKKTGGFREISAPAPRLKAAQHWILENILYKATLHHAAHGFVPERSIVSNALPHVGADVVINLDVKDFFPSVHYKRVKGLFVSLGYSEQIATVLALLCTEPQTDEVSLDGQKYYVTNGARRLPQGAPTSPAITNILCWGMDLRFEGMARSLGWNYTRYADDITCSKKGGTTQDINRVLWQAQQIIENEGFVVHPKKIKVMRKGARQEVTGVVVNEKLNISRERLKEFRAVLHHLDTKGLVGAKFGKGHILESIQGFANYVLMVNPEKGAILKEKVNKILGKPAIKPLLEAQQSAQKIPVKTTVIKASNEANSQERPLQDWWRVW
jgi:retron-type reverse transcriptase